MNKSTLNSRGYKHWDDEFMDEDPYTKVGPIRVIAIKHNKSEDTWDKRTTTIVNSEIFVLGFAAPKSDSHCSATSWYKEEWDSHDRGVIECILQDKENGIYEIVGDLYHYGYESGYEYREWNSEMDIRDEKIQKITYNQAYYFNEDFFQEEEINLTKLLDKEFRYLDWNTDISPYMDKLQILKHFANALAGITPGERSSMFGTRPSFDKSTIEELENFIFITMLQIDSESEKNQENNFIGLLALKMDEEVKRTIELNKEIFGEKD